MAHLFPDSKKSRVIFASGAEENFYDKCIHLSGNWRVYYSCTLSQMEDREGLKDNEMDFVCYHPKFGIILIEVKGGRIRYDVDRSKWFSMNRHGESFPIKDPFQQVLTFKSRFLRYLRKKTSPRRRRKPTRYQCECAKRTLMAV